MDGRAPETFGEGQPAPNRYRQGCAKAPREVCIHKRETAASQSRAFKIDELGELLSHLRCDSSRAGCGRSALGGISDAFQLPV